MAWSTRSVRALLRAAMMSRGDQLIWLRPAHLVDCLFFTLHEFGVMKGGGPALPMSRDGWPLYSISFCKCCWSIFLPLILLMATFMLPLAIL